MESNNSVGKEEMTIGMIISNAIELHELNSDTVEKVIGMPNGVLKQVMTDDFYTNSIPIVLFKNLIMSLHIPLEEIEAAMLPTFKVIQSKETPETIKKKPHCYMLWENEESVIKYTNRLKEIMMPQPLSPQSSVGVEEKKKLYYISNEDALMLGKLWHEHYEWEIVERTGISVLIRCEDYRLFIWTDGDDFVDGEELYKGEENIKAHGCEAEAASLYYSVVDMVDYLRSKGYDLPNKFSAMTEYSSLMNKEKDDKIKELIKQIEDSFLLYHNQTTTIATRDRQVLELQQLLSEKEKEVESLNEILSQKMELLVKANEEINRLKGLVEKYWRKWALTDFVEDQKNGLWQQFKTENNL